MSINDINLFSMAKNVPGMIYKFYVNADGSMGFSYVSSKAFDIYETTPEEFTRNPNLFVDMVHEEDKSNVLRLIEQSRVNMTPYEWQGRIRTRTNKVRWILAKSLPERLPDGSTSWDGLVMDVTEKIQQELKLQQINQQLKESQEKVKYNHAQLVESARLASLGEMAGGVAHEVNNPLTVIVIHSEKLKKQVNECLIARSSLGDHETPPVKKMQEMKESIEKIEATARRISKIISGLKTMSRNGNQDPFVSCTLGKVIEDALSLCQQKAKNANIDIQIQSQHLEQNMFCRPVQISQVFLNLLINAFHAVEEVENKWVRIQSEIQNKKLLIKVSDSGKGISEENKNKVFDPFFTTKVTGQGTGLGLSISRGIMQGHNGNLVLFSRSNPTTFMMELPLDIKK